MRRYVAVLILLTITAVVSGMLFYRTPASAFEEVVIDRLKQELPGWEAKDVEISERTYEILETRNVLVREYQNPDKGKLELSIVYSSSNRRVTHPPEICYIGAGGKILSREVIELDLGTLGVTKTVKMKVAFGEKQYLVIYWFKAGEEILANYYLQQAKIAGLSLIGQDAGAALIKLSRIVSEEDNDLEILREFAVSVLPRVVKSLN